MTQAQHWWLAIAVMGGLTFLLRALPLAAWRQLARGRIAGELNRSLPLCVMVILLCASLQGGTGAAPQLLAELLALAIAGASYLRWRNPLISVVVGVLALNGVEWLARNAGWI